MWNVAFDQCLWGTQAHEMVDGREGGEVVGGGEWTVEKVCWWEESGWKEVKLLKEFESTMKYL